MLEYRMIELMSTVLLAFKVKTQRSMAFIVYFVRIVSIGLGQEHLDELERLANDSVVESCTAKVILCTTVDTSFLKSVVNTLEVLNSTARGIHGEDMEKVLSLLILRLDDVIIGVL
jgi:hypothetical protein